MILLLLLVLLLWQPATALTASEEKVLDNLRTFYKQLGMEDKVRWLDAERKRGRIEFGSLEGDVSAECDMESGTITINSARAFSSYDSYVDLGETMAHEAIHQTQDHEAWKRESWREVIFLGNACEREAWEEGFRSIRRMAQALDKQTRDAPSARERAVAAARLEKVVGAWQTLTNDWQQASKRYGDIVVRDEKGFPIGWDEMAEERQKLLKRAEDATILSAAMTRPFEGSYQGSITSGATGIFNFKVYADQSAKGVVRGSYAGGTFAGTFTGSVDADGILRAEVGGTITIGTSKPVTYDFAGTVSGNLSRTGSAGGSWSAGNRHDWPSGSWSANRQ